MADQKLGLPVRTEADADERLQTKIVDATTVSQGMEVDANGDAHTRSKIVDESGNSFTDANPLPVYMAESSGTEVIDYDTAAAVAADATDNHDYTAGGAVGLLVDRIHASASSRSKLEVQVEDGVGAGTYTSVAVGFGSSSSPNVTIEFKKQLKVATGVILRLIRTNRDNQAQDLYSTVIGIEV